MKKLLPILLFMSGCSGSIWGEHTPLNPDRLKAPEGVAVFAIIFSDGSYVQPTYDHNPGKIDIRCFEAIDPKFRKETSKGLTPRGVNFESVRRDNWPEEAIKATAKKVAVKDIRQLPPPKRKQFPGSVGPFPKGSIVEEK